jgi:hypothetical protein
MRCLCETGEVGGGSALRSERTTCYKHVVRVSFVHVCGWVFAVVDHPSILGVVMLMVDNMHVLTVGVEKVPLAGHAVVIMAWDFV